MKTEPKQSCQNIAAKTECSALLLLYCELSIPYTVWAMTSGRYERQMEENRVLRVATTSTAASTASGGGGGDTTTYVRLFVVGARIRLRLGKTTAAARARGCKPSLQASWWWNHGMVVEAWNGSTVQVRFGGGRVERVDLLGENVELTSLSPDDHRHVDISIWKGKSYDYEYSPPSLPSSSSSSSSSSPVGHN